MRMMQVISDYIRRSILTTQGDLVVRGAALPERLAAGAANTVLTGQGAGVIPAYQPGAAQSATHAWLLSNQWIVGGSWIKLALNVTQWDTGSNFDIYNAKYVCTEAGIYHASCTVEIDTLAGNKKAGTWILVNGFAAAGYSWHLLGASGLVIMSAGSDVQLAVDDYVELFGKHNDSVQRRVRGGGYYRTSLSIHRVY